MDSETVLEARRTLQVLREAEQSLASLALKLQELPGVEEGLHQEIPEQPPAARGSNESAATGIPPTYLTDLEALIGRLNEAELTYFRDELRAAALQVEATRQLEADLLDAGVL